MLFSVLAVLHAECFRPKIDVMCTGSRVGTRGWIPDGAVSEQRRPHSVEEEEADGRTLSPETDDVLSSIGSSCSHARDRPVEAGSTIKFDAV